jgi:hypothetical protein
MELPPTGVPRVSNGAVGQGPRPCHPVSVGHHKRGTITVFAEDDLGGLYLSNFGGSRGHPGHEKVKLTLRPRLSPVASRLPLTLASETQQVAAEIPLTP